MLDESAYRIGDNVIKSWVNNGDVGQVIDVAIVHKIDGGEYFAYVVRFGKCEGAFLEGDLAPAGKKVIDG